MPTAHFLESDPALNRQFRRLWSETPLTAAEVDRRADMELVLGHHRMAELLASLHDDETRLAIAEAVRRAAALEELAVRWAAVERYQRSRSRVVRHCPPLDAAP